MKNEITYNKKLALITAVVLTLGSIFIFVIISKDSPSPNWNGLFLIVAPALWLFSFAPLGLCSIVNKFSKKNND